MLGFVVVLSLVLAISVYLLFYSKSKWLGKYLYVLNNYLESKLAGLHSHSVIIEGQAYCYLASSEASNKPLLFLLHGFSADKNIWLKFAKFANKDYTLIIPDLLGHGEISYSPDKEYSIKAQSEYVCKLILHLTQLKNKQTVSVMGNSMGGMIAVELLQQWDKTALSAITIDQIVLLDPAGAYSEFAKEMQAKQHNPFLHLSQQSVFNFYDSAMYKPPFMPPCVLHYIAETQYLEKYEQYSHMFSDFFDVDVFYKKQIPYKPAELILVWGDKDGLIPVADAKVWERLLSTKAQILPQIGHMPMVECPEKTFSILKPKTIN